MLLRWAWEQALWEGCQCVFPGEGLIRGDGVRVRWVHLGPGERKQTPLRPALLLDTPTFCLKMGNPSHGKGNSLLQPQLPMLNTCLHRPLPFLSLKLLTPYLG